MLILIILLVLIGSALFSGVEVALFSISLGKVMALQKKGKRGANSLLKVKENISRPITVIVIFNNIVNIVGSILVGFYATQTLGSGWLGTISAILTFLIIIFGEIIPKNIGENYAEKIGLIVAGPLLGLTKLLTPIVWLFEKITNKFSVKKNVASEEEIKILSHLGHLEGSIEKDEKEMIQNVFRLNDLLAKDIMTPRSVIVSFPGNKTLGEIKDQIYNSRQSRIPVYGKDPNDIIGVCFLKEVLMALAKDGMDRKVTDFTYEVMTVSPKSKVDYLLILFQKKRHHLAIVKDKYGTVLGLVTLEDVLEQLVGEIVDETDEIADLQEKAKNMSRDQV